MISIFPIETAIGELSKNAQSLLIFLCLRGQIYNCVAYAPDKVVNAYVVVPEPSFNWDSRVEVWAIKHPECLPELVEQGFMVYGKHAVSNGTENHVYTLTKKGERKGQQLIRDSHSI